MAVARPWTMFGFLRNSLPYLRKERFSTNHALYKKKVPTNIEYYYQDKQSYGVYAQTGGYVKEAALEAARISIVRETRNKTVYKIPARVAVTKKGEGSRMGKGKGKVAYHAAVVKPGKIMLSFEAENDTVAREAFRQASHKLPLRTHFRITPKNDRMLLNGSQLRHLLAGNQLARDYTAIEEEHKRQVQEFLASGAKRI